VLQTSTSWIKSHFWTFLTLSLVVLVCGMCVPGFAQQPLQSNFPARKSATTWSNLPPEAQRSIGAALGEDKSGWIQQAELTALDGAADDSLGQSVALSGSTLVVGAPFHTVGSNGWQGAAYVFVESGGTWTEKAELTASDGLANDKFGSSVAISGSTIVVGAFQHTVGSNTFQGAAYVYVESGGIWTQQAELTASDGGGYQDFGYSVAISGSTVLVGAYNHPVGSNDSQGAAYVFVQGGTEWSQQAELISSDGGFSDSFGQSVALSGSLALVGAPGHQVGSNPYQGAAYVFAESSGSWSQQAELIAPDGTLETGFGSSVAISGIRGVVLDNVSGGGKTYLFVQTGQTWTQQQELTVPDGFCDVAEDGGLFVDGACLGEAAYVFAENGGTWGQQAELTASDGGTQDLFGNSVAINGITVVVGAPNHEVGSNTGQGAAYVFVSPSTVVTLSPTSLIFGRQAVDTTSAAKTVTITNTGVATLYNSSIAITEGNRSFAISSNTCGAMLAAGKACKVGVTFTPKQPGAETGALIFTNNASGSPQTVTLAGTGVAQAMLAPSSHAFPKTKVGSTSAAYEFTLKNNLSTSLTGISYSTAPPFAVSASTCTTSLGSGKSCAISVTFSPTVIGTANGTLTVKDSANDSPQKAILSGTGD